jgi:hypothetical protein
MSLGAAARIQPRERTLDASLVRGPGMAHALTDEPGLEPAPQAAAVDEAVTRWLTRHLQDARRA